ncbi:mas-related G-protein coupled receptor member X1-like [Macrotis lagotis]|uniref:mas-related G-protein coupled receptor member X1-like n=1 Tax=Macrotis lagotis TaxID=92651 RepID=UPI003D68339C
MAVFPSPEQLEYVHNNSTERRENGSLLPGTEASEEFSIKYWMRILSLLITLVGLVGNGLVLWLLGVRIKRNPFSVYILNLSGADTLFLCCSFLISIHEFITYLYFPFMFEVVIYITYMFYTVGLSILAAISTERCLSVLSPIWYKCHRPVHTSGVVCAVLWTLISLLGVTDFVVCFYVYSDYLCHDFFIIEVIWFIIFTCVLCISSLTLLLRVQCSSQCQQPPRLYLLVLLTVLVFLLGGLPMGIMDFIWRFHKVFMPHWLPLLLACVNSSANPFIYFFLGSQRQRRRREPIRVILQRALGDEELGDEMMG